MRTETKIILGCTAVIGVSTIAIMNSTGKYQAAAEQVQNDLRDIYSMLSKSREDIIEGNKAQIEGNALLRDILHRDVLDKVEEDVKNGK